MIEGKKERVFSLGDKMIYELGGDFFHCSFSSLHPKLKKLSCESKGMRTAVVLLGRAKAREMKMLD